MALERPRSDTFVLPLMVLQIVLGDESHLTYFADVGLETVVLDADMFVDAGLVKGLHTQGALGRERGLLVVGHKVGFVSATYVSGEAGRMHKDLAAMVAFLGHSFVDFFHMPVQISFGLEDFAAMTKEFFGGFDGSIFVVDAFVFAQIGVTLEAFAADVAHQRGLARVNSHVFAQFVGSVEPFGAVGTLVIAFLEMPFTMVP